MNAFNTREIDMKSKFSGTVYFYHMADSDDINCTTLDFVTRAEAYIVVGQCHVECDLADSRAAQIDAIEKLIDKERAESQFRINKMLGKIQELRAIEVDK